MKKRQQQDTKRNFQALFACSVIAAIPLILFIASVYPSFHVSAWRLKNKTCTLYSEGSVKGVLWERGEWHHYIDFEIDDSTSAWWDWTVTEAPVESTVWGRYSSSSVIRVGYRWPSNWWDPFPASAWKICLLSS